MSRWMVALVVATRFVALGLGAIALRLGALPISWDSPSLEARMRVVQTYPRAWVIAWLVSTSAPLALLIFLAALSAALRPPIDRVVIAFASMGVALEMAGRATQVLLIDISDARLYAVVEMLAWRLSAGGAHLAYALATAFTVGAFAQRPARMLAIAVAAFALLTSVAGLTLGLQQIEMTYGTLGWMWCGFALAAWRSLDGPP